MLFMIVVVATAAPPHADAWPGFRGDGSSQTTARELPREWSPTKNVAWRTELPGYGQSSPVVWKERVFVTAIAGPNKETLFVLPVNTMSGRVEWRKEFATSQTGKNNPMMSRAAPTPVVDADGVYCFFESGDLIAFTHDGAKRWHRSLTKDYGDFQSPHGLGSSPTQTARAVIVQVDHSGPSYLLALDKATGKTLWKTDRPSASGWTSPVVVNHTGKSVVLTTGGDQVTAYDAMSGEPLATRDGFVALNIPSLAPAGEFILIGAGEDRRNPDPAGSARSNRAIRIVAEDGKFQFETVWATKKVISGTASPVAAGDQAYYVSKSGFIHCLDLKTGEECYTERLADMPWATPVAAGGYVYLFGKSGVTTVLKAGPEYAPVAVNRLWSKEQYQERLAEAKRTTKLPKRPAGKGPGGGPPVPKAELEAIRYSAVGDVVYGVAAVDGAFFVRTGTELIRVGAPAE